MTTHPKPGRGQRGAEVGTTSRRPHPGLQGAGGGGSGTQGCNVVASLWEVEPRRRHGCCLAPAASETERGELSWLLSLPVGTAVPPEDPPGSRAREMPLWGLRPWDSEQGFRTSVLQPLLRPRPSKGAVGLRTNPRTLTVLCPALGDQPRSHLWPCLPPWPPPHPSLFLEPQGL